MTIDLDIAQNVFQAHGVYANGKIGLHKQLNRVQTQAFFANLLPFLPDRLEALRQGALMVQELLELGHDARLDQRQQRPHEQAGYLIATALTDRSDRREKVCKTERIVSIIHSSVATQSRVNTTS